MNLLKNKQIFLTYLQKLFYAKVKKEYREYLEIIFDILNVEDNKMKNKFLSAIIKLVVILIIIFIIIFAVLIISNAKEDSKSKEKLQEEITYLDTKILNLINHLNNIKLENYKITITKVKQENPEDSGGSKEKSGTEEESKESETTKEEKQITKVEQEIVVTGNQEEIDWEWLKGETQVLYSSWSTIVLDFYDVRSELRKNSRI